MWRRPFPWFIVAAALLYALYPYFTADAGMRESLLLADGGPAFAGHAQEEKSAATRAGNFAAERTSCQRSFVLLIEFTTADAGGKPAFRFPAAMQQRAERADRAAFEQVPDFMRLPGHFAERVEPANNVGALL